MWVDSMIGLTFVSLMWGQFGLLLYIGCLYHWVVRLWLHLDLCIELFGLSFIWFFSHIYGSQPILDFGLWFLIMETSFGFMSILIHDRMDKSFPTVYICHRTHIWTPRDWRIRDYHVLDSTSRAVTCSYTPFFYPCLPITLNLYISVTPNLARRDSQIMML